MLVKFYSKISKGGTRFCQIQLGFLPIIFQGVLVQKAYDSSCIKMHWPISDAVGTRVIQVPSCFLSIYVQKQELMDTIKWRMDLNAIQLFYNLDIKWYCHQTWKLFKFLFKILLTLSIAIKSCFYYLYYIVIPWLRLYYNLYSVLRYVFYLLFKVLFFGIVY